MAHAYGSGLVGMEKAINELASQAEASDASLHPLGGYCSWPSRRIALNGKF